MDRPVLVTIIIIALVFLLLCCLCLAVVLVGGALYSWNVQLPPQTEFSWNSAAIRHTGRCAPIAPGDFTG